jgi:hypothetical protein
MAALKHSFPIFRKRQMRKAPAQKTLPYVAPAQARWSCKCRHQSTATSTCATTSSTKTPRPGVSRIMQPLGIRKT